MRRAIALIALAAALSGCGLLNRGASPPSATALASKIGCTGYAKDPAQAFIAHGGTCTYEGDRITIDVFQSEALRDRYLTFVEVYGHVYGEGPRWVIGGSPVTAVRSATAAAGGTLTGQGPL